MPKRVTFYFDGFNFYFALKRKKKISPEWKDFYWLDLVAFCESFLGPDQVLEKVIYFTASPLSPQKNSRQSAFLNANRILHPDKFEVIRGKYMSKQIECPYCKYSISKPEEKRTDVNISVRMMADCVQDKTDVNHLNAFRSKWVFLENNERRFRNAVMPHTITVGNQSVSIPEKWK